MLARKFWNKSLTSKRIMRAAQRAMLELDNPGFCLVCGEKADGCEPDARNYKCESCGAEEVFGAEELLIAFC